MKLFLTAAFLIICFQSFGQSHVYRMRISDIDQADEAKNVNVSLTKIFDKAAEVDPVTFEFSVKSDTDIEGDDFASKMLAFGYMVIYMKKDSKTLIEE